MFSRTVTARRTGYLSLPLREEGREGEVARKGYNVETPRKKKKKSKQTATRECLSIEARKKTPKAREGPWISKWKLRWCDRGGQRKEREFNLSRKWQLNMTGTTIKSRELGSNTEAQELRKMDGWKIRLRLKLKPKKCMLVFFGRRLGASRAARGCC